MKNQLKQTGGIEADKKSKNSRLRSAALVKLKYELLSGKLDDGFEIIYEGVLRDLSVEKSEVDKYIEKNKEELRRICISSN